MTPLRDPFVDTLLDFNGEQVVFESGHRVKYEAVQVPVSSEKPHGLDYSLKLLDPNGRRLVCFDNAHRVKGQKHGEPQDHRHQGSSRKPYVYQDAGTLFADFWKAVDAVLKAEGVIP
jgi:hypothetical protein